MVRGKTLTGLINSILEGKKITAVGTDASVGKKQGQYDLAMVLASLAANGKELDIAKWDEACAAIERPDKNAKPAMTIAISGANYTMPRKAKPPRKISEKVPEKILGNTANKTKQAQQSKVNTMTNVKDISSNQQQQVSSNTNAIVTNNVSNDVLQATQQSILALQKMQEQTARLHQQYLEGQETAQKSIQSLLEQQQRLMSGQPLVAMPIQQPVQQPAQQPVNQQTAQSVAPVNAPVINQEIKAEIKESAPVIKEIQETIQAKPVQNESTDVDIDNLLLKVVSEKTGYPLEMLSLDMSLDTDLGIDSIKRVEILSALQEQLPWSQSVNPEELGTFQIFTAYC